MEVHPEDYKRYFGGVDGPGPTYSEVVPQEALFLPQGGADAGAEEVRRECLQCVIETPACRYKIRHLLDNMFDVTLCMRRRGLALYSTMVDWVGGCG